MSCIINSCTVSSPLHGIVGRQGCHALIAVQSLLFFTGLWGGKDVMQLIPVQSLLLITGLWGGKDVMHY